MSDAITGERLFEDLKAVVRDAEALLKATAGIAGDKAQEVRARAEESLKQARSRLETVEGEAFKSASEMANAANNYVRENPWQAVGIAAGAGLLLGLILSRK